MKQKIKSIALALSVIVLLGFITVAPLSVTGCKSLSTQKVAANSLATIGQGVNDGYAAYLDLVVKGTVTTNSVSTVSKAFNDFQLIYNQAVALVVNSTNAAPTAAVVTAAATFNNAVTTAKKGP